MGPRDYLKTQFQIYKLLILERSVGDREIPSSLQSLDFHSQCLDRHSRRDWVCQHSADKEWSQYRMALQADHDLVLATRGDKTLGWAWLGYEKVFLPALDRTMDLKSGTAYLYESFVRPAERNRGVGSELVRMRLCRAAARGIDTVYTHVLEGNEPSLRALARLGFSIVGRTKFVKAPLVRLWTRRPLVA